MRNLAKRGNFFQKLVTSKRFKTHQNIETPRSIKILKVNVEETKSIC